ncbi:MAG: NADH-quinone oxidoreductase subunit A [Planctomycetaceae bacterium]
MVPLLLGKLVRPHLPTAEKISIYECGEPTIGTSYVQYDLRFYVVALLFIIFDVEVAFFFPWAMVFGGATQLADSRLDSEARTEISARLLNTTPAELASGNVIGSDVALTLGWLGFFDLLVFFAVLLVGFAYVWKRGDLDWVKAVADKARMQASQRVQARQAALSAASSHQTETTVA